MKKKEFEKIKAKRKNNVLKVILFFFKKEVIILFITIVVILAVGEIMFVSLSNQKNINAKVNQGHIIIDAKQKQACHATYDKLFKNDKDVNDPLNYSNTNPSLHMCLNKFKDPLDLGL